MRYEKTGAAQQSSSRFYISDQRYRQREVVVKIVCLQFFENQNESIHQSSNPPKSGYIYQTILAPMRKLAAGCPRRLNTAGI